MQAKGSSILPKIGEFHHKTIENAAELASVKSSTTFWSTSLGITSSGRQAEENKKLQASVAPWAFDAVQPLPDLSGDLDAPLLIIDQVPGLTENKQQSPFVGWSGKRLFS